MVFDNDHYTLTIIFTNHGKPIQPGLDAGESEAKA